MTHIVFFVGYIYFVYMDFKKKKINTVALSIYAFVALFTLALTKDNMSMVSFIDVLFSIGFGLIIYMLSYFSQEGIGIADGVYFFINGFLLTLKENIILFLTGLFVAFVVGLILYLFCHRTNKDEDKLPFFPCFLPSIIGYILCIV